LNIWAAFYGRQPKVRNGIRGDALVTRSAAAPEETGQAGPAENRGSTGTWKSWAAETRLIVRVPGQPPFLDQSMRPATRDKYPVIGMHLPVDVSQDLRKVAIAWDEAPTVDEFMAAGPPTFTDPDALHAELNAAWTEVVAHHGGSVPQRMARAAIEGPNARVMAFGHAGSSFNSSFARKAEMLLSVAEPGKRRYGYRWRGQVPKKTLVLQGQDLPVEVTSGGIEIPWERMREATEQLLAQRDPTGEYAGRKGLLSSMRLTGAIVGDAAQKLRMAAANPDLMAHRARISRIMVNGYEVPATIDAFTLGEFEPATNAVMTELSLTVEPQGQPAYAASFTQPLPQAVTQTLAVGQRVTARVAHDDAQAVMLWNTPHAPGGVDPA
jgi:hypothetical protein